MAKGCHTESITHHHAEGVCPMVTFGPAFVLSRPATVRASCFHEPGFTIPYVLVRCRSSSKESRFLTRSNVFGNNRCGPVVICERSTPALIA